MAMFFNHSRQKGFTLIELMIVVIIIGIITALAFPSFKNLIVKKRIENAMHQLTSCFKESQIQSLTLHKEVVVNLVPSDRELTCGTNQPIKFEQGVKIQLGSNLNNKVVFKPDRFVQTVPLNSNSGNTLSDNNGGYIFCYEGYSGNEQIVVLSSKGMLTTREGARCATR